MLCELDRADDREVKFKQKINNADREKKEESDPREKEGRSK